MKKIIALIISCMLLTIALNKTYARYVITNNFTVNVTSANLYFSATPENNKVIFPRTSNSSDINDILSDTTQFNLIVKNNDGTNYNSFETTYEISVIDSDKFTFVEGNTVTKTIEGGSIKNDVVAVNLKIKDFTKTDDTVKIGVKTIKPYESEMTYFTLNITQIGAIQYIEDLLDISLALRGSSAKYTKAEVQTERFKMTRDLNFNDTSSYIDAYRTDYKNTNLDAYTDNLITELTTNAGFLPIGNISNEFKGVFNGGNHKLTGIHIHKALQINIGLFGDTINATIKDLVIVGGNIINENQTAGMIVGKAIGGLLENIVVDGTSVMSTDEEHDNEDTYTGGIVGYVEKGATIRNCTNYATITTEFHGDPLQFSGPAGGITAWMAHSTIDSCTNYGTIIGQNYVGGIAGFTGMQNLNEQNVGGGTITNCHNYGEVKSLATQTSVGGKHIGGIAGYNKAGAVVEYSTNHKEATIKGLENVGGVVGNNAGAVNYCTNNSSNITGSISTHGVVGLNAKTGTELGNTNNPQ